MTSEIRHRKICLNCSGVAENPAARMELMKQVHFFQAKYPHILKDPNFYRYRHQNAT